uniref:Uncharacterized protein n=1 Tax=Chromera velia CCMP2878 TaxID=1169474 RepID=A0A0G4GQ87_9ALVE|eukprot:Cvel_22892.t1-p1 / transcript=Cvel_22892.t1 / gene=Cvel_22892 / organism=Chromera_velia_CCMP2878 / gene_product=hypothetical protein / transcript_product=hypothetical protein / location=Cvel_scaffold2300:2456-4309(-) / protein_length=279 / sequence_SO=supercontig / SO=protein_coding / is_pseudo=false
MSSFPVAVGYLSSEVGGKGKPDCLLLLKADGGGLPHPVCLLRAEVNDGDGSGLPTGRGGDVGGNREGRGSDSKQQDRLNGNRQRLNSPRRRRKKDKFPDRGRNSGEGNPNGASGQGAKTEIEEIKGEIAKVEGRITKVEADIAAVKVELGVATASPLGNTKHPQYTQLRDRLKQLGDLLTVLQKQKNLLLAQASASSEPFNLEWLESVARQEAPVWDDYGHGMPFRGRRAFFYEVATGLKRLQKVPPIIPQESDALVYWYGKDGVHVVSQSLAEDRAAF